MKNYTEKIFTHQTSQTEASISHVEKEQESGIIPHSYPEISLKFLLDDSQAGMLSVQISIRFEKLCLCDIFIDEEYNQQIYDENDNLGWRKRRTFLTIVNRQGSIVFIVSADYFIPQIEEFLA